MLFFTRLMVGMTFVSYSMCEVYTVPLGDIAQYSASIASPPTLIGSQILFTQAASPNDGVDILLSEELRANVADAVNKNCNEINTECVNSIKDILVNPRTTLETRQISAIAAIGVSLVGLISLAIPFWEKERTKEIPVAWHIPASQLDVAASAGQASTIAVVTSSNGPAITITPRPKVAMTTGVNGPSQTTLTSDQDGHTSGDMSISLSDDLASRLNEMMERSKECAPNSGPTAMKASSVLDIHDQIAAFICAAQALVLNSSPGSAFSELASLQAKQPAWNSPDLVTATETIVAFATSHARYMGLSDSSAITLAYVAAYLAFVRIIRNEPLGHINWYSGSDLKGTLTESNMPTTLSATPTMTMSITTATSTQSSSSVLECSASCTMAGPIRDCNTWCPTPTDDDNYIRPSNYVVKTVAFEPWTIQPLFIGASSQVPIGLCPPAPWNATDFPLDIFNNVYTKFCETSENAKENLIWTVDSRGVQLSSKTRRHRFALRDGANEDKFKDYKFTLARLIRGEQTPKCSTSCAAAYRQLSLQDMCKRGDDKSKIANTGFIDAGCATYSFSIDVPEVKPDITCGDKNSFFTAPKEDGAAGGATSVKAAIEKWCTDNNGHHISSAPGKDVAYGRWDVTLLDVARRSSFWPRARLHSGNSEGQIVKEQCIHAYTEGLSQCNSGSDRTHGFSALVGSMNYSLELSGWTQEGNPPWDTRASFPPSEDQPRLVIDGIEGAGKPYGPECLKTGSRFIHDNDYEMAIDAFCKDGGQLRDMHTNDPNVMFRYPPVGQPRFYENQGTKLYLTLGAEALNRPGRDRPYFDQDSCKGYDFKMGKEDCLYAMRRIKKQCDSKDSSPGGRFKYRCVGYGIWGINED